MATMTRVKLTPKDHGREIDPDEFDDAEGREGYHYELIDGRVYVSPVPNAPQHDLEMWLYGKFFFYSQEHPEVINHVANKSRIYIKGGPKATRPEPDLSLYQDYPLHLPRRARRWQDVNPILVVEVLSKKRPEKDLVRNVELYLEVSSIKEYWILDPRIDPDRPSLLVYRRRGKSWQKPIEVPFGGTYQTPRVLPGFSLVVDPDR
jgi:Uma2 family endonuclease